MPLDNNKGKIFLLLFMICAVADIAGIAFNITWLHYSFKPLLIPFLLLAALISTNESAKNKKLFIAALFFSWAGDMFLLFESEGSLFFIFGLASFLTTHILYIFYFLSIRSNTVSLLKKQPWFIVLVLLYGVSLVWLLFPKLGDLKIPVMVYAAVICTMLLCSMHVFYKANKNAAVLFVAGALLFVLSDSLLAVNKFHQQFALAGVWIMLTYCAAQYFIVTGFIKQATNDKS